MKSGTHLNYLIDCPVTVALYYRRNAAVIIKSQFFRVSHGDQPLAKEPAD